MGQRTIEKGIKMQKTVVIDIVGLSSGLIGSYTPFLKRWSDKHHISTIEPMLPAVTTAVQSTYITGKWPSDHGIVGNGWYDHSECEIKFWRQSDKLVQAPKIWEKAKQADPSFTGSKMFWWYNMYSGADYSVTPRPQYHADGVKKPDCYSHPAGLRDELQRKLDTFPLFNFWGPGANIKSSRWIADASLIVDDKYDPTLTLIYLPHLDYCLQKYGQDFDNIGKNLQEIDEVVEDLVLHYEKRDSHVVLLSEYGITNVNHPIHLNRVLRENDLIQVRVEDGRELLDAGASSSFAVADHQVAHVYVNDPDKKRKVRSVLEQTSHIELILDKEEQKKYHLNHERSGDFVVMADETSWFTYFYWFNDKKAPDFARLVEIHKKPGYDPVEMFMSSKLRAFRNLLKKKMGFRYLMDVIPLDANLVRGSHGRIGTNIKDHPVLITNEQIPDNQVTANQISDIIWRFLSDRFG